jgi:hypothetical protein
MLPKLSVDLVTMLVPNDELQRAQLGLQTDVFQGFP